MRKRNSTVGVIAILLMAFCILPFLYVLMKSFFDLEGAFTLEYYYKVFLAQSQYLLRFWKSLALSLCIALGQLIVSILAGYSFAKCRFAEKNYLFFLLIVWMIMPLQVTLVPNYVMLDSLDLLNTYHSLILPMIFVPLGAFIVTQSFKAVPGEIMEAAQLDGSGTLRVILRIMLPMSKSGLVCAALLAFMDGWNMVEQPIVFLKELSQYPLAVALASVPPGDPNVQLVCCVLAALPPLLLFALFNREMAEGIELGGSKMI